MPLVTRCKQRRRIDYVAGHIGTLGITGLGSYPPHSLVCRATRNHMSVSRPFTGTRSQAGLGRGGLWRLDSRTPP